jgi:hypothetical protein
MLEYELHTNMHTYLNQDGSIDILTPFFGNMGVIVTL